MKRVLFLFGLSLSLWACNGTKNVTGDELLTLQRATQQAWSGGAYGSGYGTTYVVEVMPAKATATDVYRFDTIYTDGRAFIPEVSQQGGMYVLSFEYTNRPGRNDMGEVDESIEIEKPEKAALYPDFEGKGLLVFHYGEDRYTLSISDFKRLEPLNYP